ncbi:hypothetical protein HY643_04790 [Candidatus Woesearchaeota archaeon]|nr:hypothetical protein [Candidatus Woesearchaeota archaeon]
MERKDFQSFEGTVLGASKSLQAAIGEEKVKAVKELSDYFFNTKSLPNSEYEGLRNYFFEAQTFFLNKYELNPELIAQFKNAINTDKLRHSEKQALGSFLSAMMQTSYNQGNNDFYFEEVDAQFFCAFLQGRQNNKIRVQAKQVNSHHLLYQAENCSSKIQTVIGNNNLWLAKNCSLESQTIIGSDSLAHAENCSLTTESLNGWYSLQEAKNCTANIGTYKGSWFGLRMKDCKIYSPNPKVLKRLRKQSSLKTNSFELKNE